MKYFIFNHFLYRTCTWCNEGKQIFKVWNPCVYPTWIAYKLANIPRIVEHCKTFQPLYIDLKGILAYRAAAAPVRLKKSNILSIYREYKVFWVYISNGSLLKYTSFYPSRIIMAYYNTKNKNRSFCSLVNICNINGFNFYLIYLGTSTVTYISVLFVIRETVD